MQTAIPEDPIQAAVLFTVIRAVEESLAIKFTFRPPQLLQPLTGSSTQRTPQEWPVIETPGCWIALLPRHAIRCAVHSDLCMSGGAAVRFELFLFDKADKTGKTDKTDTKMIDAFDVTCSARFVELRDTPAVHDAMATLVKRISDHVDPR